MLPTNQFTVFPRTVSSTKIVKKKLILLFLLYGCETWFLILREERRTKVRVFENRVLRRIFGSKKVGATGD
jgi:hypothetical protein